MRVNSEWRGIIFRNGGEMFSIIMFGFEKEGATIGGSPL